MADEIQQNQTPSDPTVDSVQPSGESATKKQKKVNRLSIDAINKKISELEEKNHRNSRYYKHLLMRKNELGG